jgi:cytochrome c2
MGTVTRGQTPPAELAVTGDVMQGWRVFHEKQCVACHAVWDQGGTVGPDLGRIRTGRLSGGQLAGIMWNHIPKMLARMKQAGYPPATLSEPEMADIFALVYFVRQLDELGDPAQGEQVLSNKGCTECHSLNTAAGTVGPDLAKWGSYSNPIIWAQMMWEHAPIMEAAMERSGMNWPKLEGDDLGHIVAYIRSAGISGQKTYLRPGSVDRGQRLFLQKKCDTCHPGTGPDLSVAELPTSVGALASRMWNHSPAMTRDMREQDVARQQITPQELADVLAYVLALGHQDRGGDPAKGELVFDSKGCAQCHEADEVAQESGPSVQQLGKRSSPVSVATSMWNHGESMLDQMTEAGISWPVFVDDEMVDLLAYLRAAEASK